uniref:Uncharacterized protein n=1 Tax=Oryza punctata TaxID=4537 RepID=A0A0E0MCY7_ORYPU
MTSSLSPPHTRTSIPSASTSHGFVGTSATMRRGDGDRDLEQWLESSTAREGGISSLITCPNLQVAVWRRPPHLLFQFTGACRAPRSNSPMAAATRKSSSPRLTGWSRKPASLDGVQDGIQKLNSEASGCYVEGEGTAAKVMKGWREKECVQQLLNAKTEFRSEYKLSFSMPPTNKSWTRRHAVSEEGCRREDGGRAVEASCNANCQLSVQFRARSKPFDQQAAVTGVCQSYTGRGWDEWTTNYDKQAGDTTGGVTRQKETRSGGAGSRHSVGIGKAGVEGVIDLASVVEHHPPATAGGCPPPAADGSDDGGDWVFRQGDRPIPLRPT